MLDIQTSSIKYIYLDIVGFTKNRSVEAQSDLIIKLNSIIRRTIEEFGIGKEERIFIPTGDGICIALLVEPSAPYDIHLKIALSVLQLIQDHNESMPEKKRQFQVRIGINQNVDNLVTDINDNRNVAGSGVNMAQRIMNTASGNQILVGQTVYEQLQAREKYMNSFREFRALAKHDHSFTVYQYRDNNAKGLNNEIPDAFSQKKIEEPRLTQFSAYYFAYAIKYFEFFKTITKEPSGSYTSIILLYFMALDSVNLSKAKEYDLPEPLTWGKNDTTIQERYKHYDEISSLDFYISVYFSMLIEEKYLEKYKDFFEDVGYFSDCIFVTLQGKEKLRREWPEIFIEYELSI
ncbi:MAG TPA: adenylate/guanylate cyclase domain-containing protein [Syntrophales bacterium]|nr:adenylate/guanylate cyclase domain-containing protein [Syntrophales bacterium]HQN78001.1 adenylate/guanylate cyclase domain-containing protein [Syntrophales bacterium]HQQ26827.1 adenylate/guanylate cyclase domain-containing protein [Syntrophales bacterium]